MTTSDRPLSILAVVNLPWDSRLGASRVWIELTRQWIKDGHKVDKYCLTDAYPVPSSSNAISSLQQLHFPARAAAHVRQHAEQYDVIDALIGVLPYRKTSLGFRNLLVARSVGLYRLYDRFLRRAKTLWPDVPQGRWFGRILHGFVERRSWTDSERSVRTCDLLNVPNEDERLELEQQKAITAPAIVQPYGLQDDFREALAQAAAPAEARLQSKKICFIGMWGPRKGSRDWPKIIAAVRRRHPGAEFLFLGTMFDESAVRRDLGSLERISLRCHFTGSELPAFLADCAVAVFPSYIEGFGLAVLEQLAAGLPTVAYDVSGPRQILRDAGDRMLCTLGDTTAVAARVSEILELSVSEYQRLSAECQAIAARYRWSEIARQTIVQYRDALARLETRRAEDA